MGQYNPQGRCHAILERLSLRDAGFLELQEAVRETTGKELTRKKGYHVIGGLLRDELIGGVHSRYYILADGHDALVALRDGKTASVGRIGYSSVRVFHPS
jgi:hypothetical protein